MKILDDKSIKISTGKIWYSPIAVNTFILNQLSSGSSISNEIKQNIKDLQIANIVAPILYAYNEMPAFIQLFKPDPPDAVILQYNHKKYDGQCYITQLEITSHLDNTETLLESLIRTKFPIGFDKPFSKNYILVVVIAKDLNVDNELEEITNHLNSRKMEFPIWILRDVSQDGDTMAEVTFIDDKIQRARFNVGAIVQDYKTQNFPYILERKRVGSLKKLKTERIKKDYPAPWDTIRI